MLLCPLGIAYCSTVNFLLAAACTSWDESRHLIHTPSSAAMYCKQKALSMRYTLTSASFKSFRRDHLESLFNSIGSSWAFVPPIGWHVRETLIEM